MELPSRIELRNLHLEDYDDLKKAMLRAYASIGDMYWGEHEIARLLELFPEGQLALLVNGRVAACALSIIVDYARFGDNHTYAQITGNFMFSTHDPQGDTLYGIEVFVHPEYRGLRLGRRLYDARKELCENLNLRAIVAGGRIPNYAQYAHLFTPRQYIEKVRLKDIFDPVLTFQLSNDFQVKKILRNYLLGDVESQEYATLLEWSNIYYEPEERLINAPRTVIRIGVVQWQMRHFDGLDALMEQVEFFIDAVSGYQADFIIFPELFNAPLMTEFNHLGEAQAIRELAQFTEEIRDRFCTLAVSYNINIIAGSMPTLDGTRLLNTSYLCRRDGGWDVYHKIHITPAERRAWGMVGGDRVKVFDTDCGKIGIQICYDVEFPEVSRLYAQQGMQILFVPFLTDTRNAYNRVRRTAQARAVENECYVVIAGSVGNLPRVNNMDIQYAQSAIFSPSDFSFPADAINAEATPNTEMIVIGDINLELLKELHEFGSVQTRKDRRTDLYEVVLKRRGSARPDHLSETEL
ncbi:MAG: bifunctional GNAT family N-acetyltransferase/carbon-nitrogen hydrolase family protein [Bacteroidia bacterium]|nr:bifunctional GNAT family N-acetyltransferase/carbon-nitrogen hydrolase family protein [Bacteroidia bacterium]